MTVFSTLADPQKVANAVVIIDVFRSSNTIIELLRSGAANVIPVEDEHDARHLKKKHAAWKLFGERHGIRLPGFDGDNSPAEVSSDIGGKTAVLTTSGGTRCIAACGSIASVFIGSFANAAALIGALRDGIFVEPAFWAVGLAGETPAREDELCAEYLNSIWHGIIPDFDPLMDELQNCDGATRLRKAGLDDDLVYCIQKDITNVVPRIVEKNGIRRFVA